MPEGYVVITTLKHLELANLFALLYDKNVFVTFIEYIDYKRKNCDEHPITNFVLDAKTPNTKLDHLFIVPFPKCFNKE